MPNPAKPEIITWARKRAKMQFEDLSSFKNLRSWEAGTTKPSVEELYDFAKAVYVPVGYLFADEPPEEPLPIKDFRSYKSGTEPSLELRDTINACILQQDWYREELEEAGNDKLAFVASAKLQDPAEEIAKEFASRLGFAPASARRKEGNIEAAFRELRKKADQIGIVVNVSNVVLNTSRKLDAKEFRGFALSDEYAPLVFVNSADSKSGQIFTLAHELGHLLLGVSALDNASKRSLKKNEEERWCNKFAAELLVPADELKSKKKNSELDDEELKELAAYFNVSHQVILVRLKDVKQISQQQFDVFWRNEKVREADKNKKEAAERKKAPGGPDYYTTVRSRFGKTFSKALCLSVAEGHTLTRDAMRLLGVKKLATYSKLREKILRKE